MLLLDETKLARRSLARNELLFRQGDKVEAIYFIEEGRLRLDRRTFDGRTLVFGTGSAGQFFVDAALFSEIFHCDGVATEPSRVRIYPKTGVLNALNADPSSAVSFMKLLAHQFIQMAQRFELIKNALREGTGDALSRSACRIGWDRHRARRAARRRRRIGPYTRSVLSNTRQS